MSLRQKITLPYLALTTIIAILGAVIIVRQTNGFLGVGGLTIYVLFFLAVLLAVIVVGYVVAQTILKPIHSLAQTAKTVTNGDLGRRTNLHTHDEVGYLANTFDEMTSHLQERIQELERSYKILEQQDRTKIRFVQVMAHELRTPLTSIMGLSALLVEKTKINDPVVSKYARGILEGSDRMDEIIDSMLDVTRIDSNLLSLGKTRLSLDQVLKKVYKVFEEVLEERNIQLIDHQTDEQYISGDASLLFKVFMNVIGNAIKYTPDGGSIAISRKLMSENGQSQVEVVIRDTGIGIEPAQLELIFEKFYQTGEVLLHSSGKTKFKGGGPGLGLAIARGIIQAHGGRIWAESAGHDEETFPGSTFHIQLPGVDEKNE